MLHRIKTRTRFTHWRGHKGGAPATRENMEKQSPTRTLCCASANFYINKKK